MSSNRENTHQKRYNLYAMMRFGFILSICMLFLSVDGDAQERKLDRLEMYYDQGHYKMVYRKSKRYIRRDKFEGHPLPYLYKALTTFRMWELENKGFRRRGLKNSYELFQKFKEKDTSGYYYDAHIHEIDDYRIHIYYTIHDLHHAGKQDKAKEIYNLFNTTFRVDIPYETIINYSKQDTDDSEVEVEVPVETPKGMVLRDSIVEFGKQFIGVPYQWGGNDPTGFDCSGYTCYVMRNYGITLPRIAGDQYYQACEPVKVSKAQPGDLVFFGTSKKKVAHVGLVISKPGEPLTMLHASSSRGIMISKVEGNSYWEPRLLFAGRVIKE